MKYTMHGQEKANCSASILVAMLPHHQPLEACRSMLQHSKFPLGTIGAWL